MSAQAIPYGAIELKRAAQRNLTVGLALSVLIHLGIISVSLFSNTQYPIDTHHGRTGGTWLPQRKEVTIDLGRGTIGDPATPQPGIQKSHRRDGFPVMVKEVPQAIDEDPAPLPVPPGGAEEGGEGSGEAGGGQGVFEGLPEEPPPPIFQVVEREPVLVNAVKPVYPPLALRAEVQGKVYVRMWVDKTGKVRQVVVLKSDNEMLDEAAVDAARQFLFVPAYMSTGPVSVWVSVPFSFSLLAAR